jgi:hypothetical protein
MKYLFIILLFFFSVSSPFAETMELNLNREPEAWASSYYCETINGEEICYTPDLACDWDLTTCWVEGHDSYGIGESIIIFAKTKVDSMEIVNGFARSDRLYKLNSRVKRMEISFVAAFTGPAMVSQYDDWLYLAVFYPLKEVTLEDTPESQFINLEIDFDYYSEKITDALREFLYEYPFMEEQLENEFGITRTGEITRHPEYYVEDIAERYCITGICIKIRDVYRGTEFNDTCITEIMLYN